jgi:hypothetical protein
MADIDLERIDYDLGITLAMDGGLDGGAAHTLDELEELRLLLKSILRKELLESLMDLYIVLDKQPRFAQMYSWFVRESEVGADCKYAKSALKQFKEERLELVLEKLDTCHKLLKGGKLE